MNQFTICDVWRGAGNVFRIESTLFSHRCNLPQLVMSAKQCQDPWAANGLYKVLEMHFDFPFNLIGKLSIVLQKANRGVNKDFCTGSQTNLTRGLPVIPVVLQAMSLCKLERLILSIGQ